MKIVFAILVVAVSMVAISSGAYAHHGNVAYDMSKLVTVKGTVTEYYFTNPHVQLLISAKKEDGAAEKWRGELNSPNIVARVVGWNSKTFKPGDELVLLGNRAKDGTNVLCLEKIQQPDGTELYPKGGNGVSRF